MLASDYDKSKYLKASDLEREKKFRIKTVTEEEFEQDNKKKEKKLVVWFTNDERGLVLNKINNRTIRGAFGDPVEGWPDKIVVIFPTLADNRGKQPAATASPPKPTSSSGNGAAAPLPTAAAPTKAAPPADPELEPDPVKSAAEEMDDEITF